MTARIRMSTEGRAVLSGFTDEVKTLLRKQGVQWQILGNLERSNFFLIAPAVQGLSMSKDGRMFVAGGQDLHGIRSECELSVTIADGALVCTVVGRETPSAEKIANMLARPTKPPTVKVDPNAMYLFEDLAPKKRGSSRG